MKVSEAIRQEWGDVEITLNCPENGCETFSWSPCDGCGSRLGGERHDAVAWTRDAELAPHVTFDPVQQTDIEICADCLDFLANGQDYDFETREPIGA